VLWVPRVQVVAPGPELVLPPEPLLAQAAEQAKAPVLPPEPVRPLAEVPECPEWAALGAALTGSSWLRS